MMQNQGYLIELKPEYLVEDFDRYARSEEWFGRLKLRQVFKQFNPSEYRGISREPLQPSVSFDQKINDMIMENDGIKPTNVAAGHHYRNILGDPDYDIYQEINRFNNIDRILLSSVNDAEDIISLTDNPSKWEIIQVSRYSYVDKPKILGYDIGYWGGDHFSLIADVFVIPIWHPPAPEDFENIIQALSSLNDHLLFNSPEEAENYRQFYKSRSWAETEDYEGEFCIIQINSVDKS